jgi:hypothetical protein
VHAKHPSNASRFAAKPAAVAAARSIFSATKAVSMFFIVFARFSYITKIAEKFSEIIICGKIPIFDFVTNLFVPMR